MASTQTGLDDLVDFPLFEKPGVLYVPADDKYHIIVHHNPSLLRLLVKFFKINALHRKRVEASCFFHKISLLYDLIAKLTLYFGI